LDALLSILSVEDGIRSFVDLQDRLGPEFEGWMSSDSVYITGRSYINYAEQYGFFGSYGATDGQMIMTSRAGQSVVYQMDVPQHARYKLFLKLYATDGTVLSVGLDGRPPQTIQVDPTDRYHFLEVTEADLRQGRHSMVITTEAQRPVVVNMVYAVETGIVDAYAVWFDQLTSQNAFSTSQDLAGYLRSLPPANREGSVYYYSRNIYTPVLRGEMGDEIVTPTRAWYSQVALLPSSPHSIDEIEVTYLPGRTFVWSATVAYMAYMTFMGIVSLVVLSREHGFFANVKTVSDS
jgi:hypothetical protein